ncbi:hypothetical protein [Pontibacter sp. FD36]|nr:hypothetical protein [Pontibacter sp. FD36]
MSVQVSLAIPANGSCGLGYKAYTRELVAATIPSREGKGWFDKV